MSQDDAVIRPYEHNVHNKLVKFMVAKSAMESLAVANRNAILHPLSISIWLALSSIFVQVLDWWPDARLGIWGYLRPLPAFAVLSLPLIFFIDWYQRPHFETDSIDALKRPDIANVKEYYGRTPSSGLWIYEFGDKFVGLIAVDASVDSLSNETVSPSLQVAEQQGKTKAHSNNGSRKAKDSSTAVIRHLYVAEPYRVADAQDDLIAFAVKRLFDTSGTVQRIKATPSPILTYLGRSLKRAGFEIVGQGAKVGILGWTTLSYELTRGKYASLQEGGP